VSVEEAEEQFEGGEGGTPGSRPRPDEGVYVYEGSGTESLSILPGEHAQGPELPATITHRDNGCWVFRIDYHEDHSQSFRFCPRGDLLEERSTEIEQAWGVSPGTISSRASFECGPGESIVIDPAADPGDSWRRSCSGTNDTLSGTTVSAGPYRFVGVETVTVDDEEVEALHFHDRRTISGAQHGDEVLDFWLRATDGLPLRNERTVEVTSPSPLGDVTYRETGAYVLTALEPRGGGGG
jgi:hypothetical protein